MTLDELFGRVLSKTEPDRYEGVAAWWNAQTELTPIDGAIAGGARADRLAWAFASGYAAALRSLVKSNERMCVAATEENGAHPRAIQTSYMNGRLVGRKRWVTLGTHAEVYVVFVKTGEHEGRPVLRAARVRRDLDGVKIIGASAVPFVPEIEHADIAFDVAISESDFLPGDGYADYLKPFRTIEDLYVHAALLAHLASAGMRNDFPKPLVAKLTSAIASAHALSSLDPKHPRTHVALGGLIASSEALIREIEPLLSGEMLERWQRDKGLFGVAGKARAERFARAWERL